MDGLKVCITCLLLKMALNLINAQPLLTPRCPTCSEGYFVEKNCSVKVTDDSWREGVRCRPCTDCSAGGQDTLVKCSTFADSLCGNRSAPAITSTPEAPVSVPEVWIILTVIVSSLFLVLLLVLFLILMSYRNRKQNKAKGLDPL